MNRLTNALWHVTNFILFGALSRRRARAAAGAARRREFERLSRLRGFRREFLRVTALRQVNAHPALRHLPRRVRRGMARDAGNGAFRRERGLPEIQSRGHWHRAVRLAYDVRHALGSKLQRGGMTLVGTRGEVTSARAA